MARRPKDASETETAAPNPSAALSAPRPGSKAEPDDEAEGPLERSRLDRNIWAEMFEGADDPIAAVDETLSFIAMNSAYRTAFERYFGLAPALGRSLEAHLDHMPDVREAAVRFWRRALKGETVDVPRSREAGANGAYYDIKFRPIRDSADRVIGAFQYSRDVTQRVRASERLREAQAALQRAQKMESLGQLTGGVAHDFNNLLQVIGGNLQLLSDDLAGRPKAERRIQSALAAVDRGSKLASQLLAFGRRQPLEPRVVNLERLLAGMDDLLRRAIGEAVEVQILLTPKLWRTRIDPGQIENALLNLALNARDAMDGRGRLTIEAANAVLDEAYAARHAETTAGDYVALSVSDTGSGIEPGLLDKVFEPFFTTKSDGRGTGLGLSMVYGLVKQSGGHVKIYSEVGRGTSVKLYLPRIDSEEDPIEAPTPSDLEGGEETVLVVEDDDAVRETAVALLGGLGYQVLKAADASSALAVIESGLAIDLLFTDVVMPGPLRSPDLARRALERLPGLRVLFTSGYTENAIVHGGHLDEGVELLSKPYRREALARKVRSVLDRERDGRLRLGPG